MNKNFNKHLFFVIGIIFSFFIGVSAPTAHAQINYKEMLQKSDEARGNEEGIQWEISMNAVENGREQYRKLHVIAKGYNSLINTLAPGNVKGQKLLMQDRNMWFAKPGLSKPVPISPRQKLMGTAANGDIASTNYAGDYKIVSTEEGRVKDEPCIVMNLQALDGRATYDRIKYWVSKERLVGLKAEFYTVSGKMFKTATFEYENSITVNEQPREFISKMIISSAIIKGDVTIINYSKPVLKKVSGATFNLNLLTK
ncbi:MAG: outer membrane lipoprotein-sorting protein [Deltaproteobacteria bacterium]|nr:outer membrane lipoprotein-sorting protein [Deltaproteobacteria bacterium]